MGTVSGPLQGAYKPTESSRVQSNGIYGWQSNVGNGLSPTTSIYVYQLSFHQYILFISIHIPWALPILST
jgi:hypothetical protein